MNNVEAKYFEMFKKWSYEKTLDFIWCLPKEEVFPLIENKTLWKEITSTRPYPSEKMKTRFLQQLDLSKKIIEDRDANQSTYFKKEKKNDKWVLIYDSDSDSDSESEPNLNETPWEHFFNNSPITLGDTVKTKTSYFGTENDLKGIVVEVFPVDEDDNYDHQFEVEFRLYNAEGKRVHLFRETIPLSQLELVKRKTTGFEKEMSPYGNFDQPAPLHRLISPPCEETERDAKAQKYEFPFLRA